MLEKIETALRRRIAEESGATAVEYALMVAAIAALIIVIVFALGNTVESEFCTVNEGMTAGSAGVGTTTC